MEVYIVCHYDLYMLGVGQFGEGTERVSSKWNCILCDMICVCWELDSLGSRLRE